VADTNAGGPVTEPLGLPLLPVAHPPRRPWLGALSFLGLAVAGLIVLGVIALRSGPVPFSLGLVLALVPVPVLALGVLGLDRYEPEPLRLLVFTFAWGATAAALVALVLNTADLLALRALLDDGTANFLSASLGAPVIEECAKGAVILGLLRLQHHELDGPIDGIVYAGLVGLGFAMTENVLYYSAAAVHGGVPGLLGTFLLRGVISPFLHPLFTAATGIGLGFAALARTRAGRVLPPVIGLAVAMLLHGTWNAAATRHHTLVVYLYLMFPVLLAVLAVAAVEQRRLRRLMARVLPMYARAGWLGPADIGMLTSVRRRRQARRVVHAGGGGRAERAMRDFQAAATELALLHDRGERHQVDAPTYSVRQQVLLRQLAVSRAGVIGPAPQASRR